MSPIPSAQGLPLAGPGGHPTAPVRHLAPGRPVVGQTRVLAALALLATDPRLGGAVLIGPPGSGRRWLAETFPSFMPEGAPFIAIGGGEPVESFGAHLDWEATLRYGRPIERPGLWEQARGGALFIANGEAMHPGTAAWLGRTLAEPGAPVLLVRATAPEGPAPWENHPALGPLAFRLAFWLPLDPLQDVPGREAVLQTHRGGLPRGQGGPGADGGLLPFIGTGALCGKHLAEARGLLPRVACSPERMRYLCQETEKLGWGHPALDLLVFRAARARAALHRRDEVTGEDVDAAIGLVLAPRIRARQDGAGDGAAATRPGSAGGPGAGDPGDGKGSPVTLPGSRPAAQEGRGAGSKGTGATPGATRNAPPGPGTAGKPGPGHGTGATGGLGAPDPATGETVPGGGCALGQVYRAAWEARHQRMASRLTSGPLHPTAGRRPSRGRPRVSAPGAGRPPWPWRAPGSGNGPGSRSHYPAGSPRPAGGRLAFVPTLLAALPRQPFRERRPGLALNIAPGDLAWRRPEPRPDVLYILAVDASGSMGPARTRAAKGMALALLRRAYMNRAQVCLIRAGGRQAELVLPPSRSSQRVEARLDALPTGGGTPLAGALAAMDAVAARYRARAPHGEIVALLFTDGRPNVPWQADPSPAAIMDELHRLAARLRRRNVPLVVLDRDTPGLPARDARELAHTLGAGFIPL